MSNVLPWKLLALYADLHCESVFGQDFRLLLKQLVVCVDCQPEFVAAVDSLLL